MGAMKRLATAKMFRGNISSAYSALPEVSEPKIVNEGDYVVQLEKGRLFCTCPYFSKKLIFKKDKPICKHAERAIKKGHFKKVGGRYVTSS